MRNSSVLVGLVCGVLLSTLLAVPLAIDVPGRFLVHWMHAAPGGSVLALIASALVPVVAGFVAGRINPDEALRAGTGAGTVTALIAEVLVVSPGTGVWAAGELYAAVTGGRATAATVERLIAESIVACGWMPALGATALLLAGLVLGALGGFLSDMSGAGPRRAAREVHRSSVPMVGMAVVALAVVLESVLAAHAEVTLLPALHQPLGWVDRVKLTAPLAAGGVVDVLLLAWTLRDAVMLWRSKRRVGGLVWASMALSLAVSAQLATLIIHPRAWLGPVPWAVGLAELVTVGAVVVRHWNSDVSLAEAPQSWFELAIEGLEMGIVGVGLFAIAGGSTVVALWVQVLPTAWAVAGGSATLDLDASALVTRQFLVHLAGPVLMLAVAGTYAVVATPLWLVGIAVVRRAEARGR